MKTAVIGGGAAGFFLAIELKKIMPEMDVTIFEAKRKCLAKVEISGGGRCNCSNSFQDITDLKNAYPRGFNLMKRALKHFSNEDTYQWFENHGVKLVTQKDGCVFPASQDSHSIINCFLSEAHHLGISVKLSSSVKKISKEREKLILYLQDSTTPLSFDFVAVTVGGQSRNNEMLTMLEKMGHKIEQPVPSLFTFNIKDQGLRNLMGLVVENVITSIPGTNMHSRGDLLITHWGFSGPATLKLSSYAARYLYNNKYISPIIINWSGLSNTQDVETVIDTIIKQNGSKLLANSHPFNLPTRLWQYLLTKAEQKADKRWTELGKKGFNKIVNILTNDEYTIDSRSTYKDEFVTCGGVSLESVNSKTMESKVTKGLFFAGEIIDIDGITGGFNFQAAWTTAYIAAHGISSTLSVTG